MALLGPHPPPPSNPKTLKLAPLIAKRVEPLYRIHRVRQAPLFYGKTGNNRFDAPAREFGVLYASFTPEGAFIETFGHATGVRLIEERELAMRALAKLHANKPLRLVDLTGKGLARVGADARLFAGEHGVAQLWSRTLHDHPEKADGILYLARHDPRQPCAAIFDRARPVISATTQGSLIDASMVSLVQSLLDEYDFGLV